MTRAATRSAPKHRLAKPFRPQTTGMVERFNRRLAKVLRTRGNVHARRKFDTHQQRDAFIFRAGDDYELHQIAMLGVSSPCASPF